MRRLEHRVYAGMAGETVTVDTEVEGSGAVTVLVDNRRVDADTTFELKDQSGDETRMSIRLVGAVGDSCVVQIGEVDGTVDPDLLLCQTIDAAPVHLYRFIVTPESALAAMERVAPRTFDRTFVTTHAKRATRAKSVKRSTSVKQAKSAKAAKATKAAKKRAAKPRRRPR